jgi:hypothetical protein
MILDYFRLICQFRCRAYRFRNWRSTVYKHVCLFKLVKLIRDFGIRPHAILCIITPSPEPGASGMLNIFPVHTVMK